jgi:hypothetical protein
MADYESEAHNIYANVSLRYDYETEPAEGAENEDTTFVFGIGAEF